MSFLSVIYVFGIFPLLLGLLWLGKKERAGFSKIYVRGFFSMLALFEMTAAPMAVTGRRFGSLLELWRICAPATGGAAILILLIRRKTVIKWGKELFENTKIIKEKLYRLVVVMIVAMLFSIVFVLPAESDDTPETAGITVETDTMYVYEPYTKLETGITFSEKSTSPLEMLYAAGAVRSGLDTTFFIHMVLPFFLLPLFYAVCWELSGNFWRELSKRGLFVLFMMIFYSAACYTRTIPAMGVFQNIWNAASLFACCGIPALLSQCFQILQKRSQGAGVSVKEVFFLIIMAAANQLMIGRGAMLSVLAVLSCAGILLYRKLYRNAEGLLERGAGRWIERVPGIFGALFCGVMLLCWLHEGIRNSWLSFGRDTVYISLLFLAVIWIFLYEKNRTENSLFLYTVCSVFLILVLQLLSMAVLHRDMMPKTYYLIPYAPIVSYVGVRLAELPILRKNKWIIIILYAIIIQSGIGLEYHSASLFGNYNDKKVSQTVMRMAGCVKEAAGEEEPFLLAPGEIASQIQEYDVDIRVAYGATYNYPAEHTELLLELMGTYGSNCLILKEEYDDEKLLKSKGYRLVIIFDGYSLYYKK